MLTVARDTLRGQLASITHVLRLYSSADHLFPDAATAWFEAATSASSGLDMRARSALARESAFATSSARGYRDPALPLDLVGERAQLVTLGLCVARAEAVLHDELRAVEAKLETITEKLVQLLAVASREIPLTFEDGVDAHSQAVSLWSALERHGNETSLMVSYVRLALGQGDRVALIAELVARAMADQASSHPRGGGTR